METWKGDARDYTTFEDAYHDIKFQQSGETEKGKGHLALAWRFGWVGWFGLHGWLVFGRV